jgi:hypothetical protein
MSDDISFSEYRSVVGRNEAVDSIAQDIATLPWYVQERALETLQGREQDVRFMQLRELPVEQRDRLKGLLRESYEREMEQEIEMDR